MADDDSENVGIPVALVDADTFNDLYTISLWGRIDKDGESLNGFTYMGQLDQSHYFVNMLVHDTLFATPLHDVTPIAPLLEALPFLSHADDRLCVILIANGLNKSLKLSGDPFQARGKQTGHPDTQTPRAQGPIAHSDPNIIPGRSSFPSGNRYGVGIYRFAKYIWAGIGYYGTEGAITFTTEDPRAPHPICIGWRVDQNGGCCCAATMDLTQYGTDEDFFNATIAQDKLNYGHGLADVGINLTMKPLDVKGKTFPHFQVITAVVHPNAGITP